MDLTFGLKFELMEMFGQQFVLSQIRQKMLHFDNEQLKVEKKNVFEGRKLQP